MDQLSYVEGVGSGIRRLGEGKIQQCQMIGLENVHGW